MVTIFEWKDAFVIPKEAEIIILVHNAAAANFQWCNVTFICIVYIDNDYLHPLNDLPYFVMERFSQSIPFIMEVHHVLLSQIGPQLLRINRNY